MLEFILLVLLGATGISFIALTLDEVRSRLEIRRSQRTPPFPPKEAHNLPSIEQSSEGDEERQAA